MKERKKEGYLVAGLVLLSLVLYGGEKAGKTGWLRRIPEKPFLAGEAKLYLVENQLVGALGFLAERQKADDELLRVQGQLCQLAFDQSRLAACEEENGEMRKLLGAPLPADWRFLPVRVIGKVDGLRLGAGAEAGVREGMMVVTQNILIGRVKSTADASARVEKIGDPEVKIPVVIKRPAAGSTAAPAAVGGVVGRGLLVAEESGLWVDQILQEEDVAANDLILTAGEAGWQPDLVIGIVEEVSGREAEVYKRAKIRPLAAQSDLRVVFVVTGD